MSYAKIYYDAGQKYPYDRDDDGAAPEGDWAVKAARGVINDLSDRRDIKRGFEQVDEEVRREIVASMAEIIRLARATA